MQKRNLNKLKEISFPLASILVALILGAIIMSAMGYDVGKAYSSLLKGAFGSKNSIAETLIQTTPLIFTALSYAIALRCGLVNLGAEGSYTWEPSAVPWWEPTSRDFPLCYISFSFCCAALSAALCGG